MIDEVLGDLPDLPENDDAGPALVKYLENLSSEDAGRLNVDLEK